MDYLGTDWPVFLSDKLKTSEVAAQMRVVTPLFLLKLTSIYRRIDKFIDI